MKKIFFIFVLFISSLGFTSLVKAEDFKPKIYLGLYGGYSFTEGVASADAEPSGLDYGGFAGLKFEDPISDDLAFTLGIEFSAGGASVEDDGAQIILGANVSSTFEKNYEYGASVRPGLSFKPSASFVINPYAILGYRRTEYDITASAGGASASVSQEYDGFELGLGTNLLTYNNFDLRFEYSHTFYDEEGTFSPDEDSFRFGLVYHFDMP